MLVQSISLGDPQETSQIALPDHPPLQGRRSIRQDALRPICSSNEVGSCALRLGSFAQSDRHLVDHALEGEGNLMVFGDGRSVVRPTSAASSSENTQHCVCSIRPCARPASRAICVRKLRPSTAPIFIGVPVRTKMRTRTPSMIRKQRTGICSSAVSSARCYHDLPKPGAT
jgi:hypothetical protein